MALPPPAMNDTTLDSLAHIESRRFAAIAIGVVDWPVPVF